MFVKTARQEVGRGRRVGMEELETRRYFVADLSWGPVSVQGNLFVPGQTANITANIRNISFDNIPANAFSVEFRYAEVGFRADASSVNFYDPSTVSITTIPVPNAVPGDAAGISVNFAVTFPASLAPGRYVLLAQLDSTNAISEMNETNNTLAVGTGRVLPPDGNLVVNGTDLADHIVVTTARTTDGAAGYKVTVGTYSEVFSAEKITGFSVNGLGGNDIIAAVGLIPNFVANGGDGNDKIIGGSGNDTLSGGAGKDYLDGGLGNDRLNGNGGNDRLFGGAGLDRLYGYNGNDMLDGGASSDRLDGGAGSDTMFGESGNDKFTSVDGEKDFIYGASGNDTASADAIDVLSSTKKI